MDGQKKDKIIWVGQVDPKGKVVLVHFTSMYEFCCFIVKNKVNLNESLYVRGSLIDQAEIEEIIGKDYM
jgi:hypothetical protein